MLTQWLKGCGRRDVRSASAPSGPVRAHGALVIAAVTMLLGASAERRRLVVSGIEHPSVLERARHLEARGIQLTIVPVAGNGVVVLELLHEALASDVALVSSLMVNN